MKLAGDFRDSMMYDAVKWQSSNKPNLNEQDGGMTMQGKFQYVIAGAMITLLVILGAFTVLSSPTLADISSKSTQAAGTGVEHPNDPGTIDESITDLDAILARLTEFAHLQDEAVLGRPGWLHVKSVMTIPEERRGNGYFLGETNEVLPMEALNPDNQVSETWYHVDETGSYDQGMGLVSSPDGAIYQQTILADGTWVNLTLKAAGAYRQQYESRAESIIPLMPTALVLSALEERREWQNVSIQAYLEGDRFIVVAEQEYNPPIDNDISIAAPIVKGREIFTFVEKTGYLFSREVQVLPLNDTWLTIEEEEYLVVELESELPEEVLYLFDNAMKLLEEGK